MLDRQVKQPKKELESIMLVLNYESYHCKADVAAREIFYKTGLGRKIKKAIIDSMGS